MRNVFLYILVLIVAGCSGGHGPQADGTPAQVAQQCDTLFAQGKRVQAAHDYEGAIGLYKQCIQVDIVPEDSVDAAAIQQPVVDALLQMMNSYQAMGQPVECCRCFDSIMAAPAPFIRRYCMRDLYTITAYAMSRADSMERSERLMRQALNTPLWNPNYARLFRDYAYAAAIFFPNTSEQENVIVYAKKGLTYARLSGKVSGAQYVESMLGSIYQRTGRIRDAIDLYQESIEEAQKRNDPLGEINALNAMAEMMLYWDLNTQANDIVNRGLRITESKGGSVDELGNPVVFSILYIHKAEAMRKLNKPDSALVFLERAQALVHDLPYNSGMSDIDVAMGAIYCDGFSGVSPTEARKRLVRASSDGTPRIRARAYSYLADYAFRSARRQEGEAYLDCMYHILHSSPNPIYIDKAYAKALEHYIAVGDNAGVAKFAAAYLQEQQFNTDLRNIQKVTDNVVKHYLTEKDLQINLLEAQVHARRQTIWIIALAALLLCAILGIIISSLRRTYRQRRQMAIERIDALESDRNALNEHLQTERAQLQRIQSQIDEIKNDRRQRSEITAEGILNIKDSGSLEAFELRFDVLYPGFTERLRQRASTLSKREVLLCMLLILKQSTAQISEIMTIEPRSINMMRYRVRKKLALGSEESLEDVLHAIAGQPTELSASIQGETNKTN